MTNMLMKKLRPLATSMASYAPVFRHMNIATFIKFVTEDIYRDVKIFATAV
jgi:hypothetical protein